MKTVDVRRGMRCILDASRGRFPKEAAFLPDDDMLTEPYFLLRSVLVPSPFEPATNPLFDALAGDELGGGAMAFLVEYTKNFSPILESSP